MNAFEVVVAYLTGEFAYAAELQAFWMAMQGAMAVRNGPNAGKKLHWFHAFCLSVLTGYAGALFAPLWMGRPTSMLSNDLNFAVCILAFLIVNCLPFDAGFKLCNTLPVRIVMTAFAQLFRANGIAKFSNMAYEEFKDSPSSYYPTPVFGPIVWPTLLGNMGGLFANGVNAYLAKGMPWPFQNGLVCASFYHFMVHDTKGVIGQTLRRAIRSMGPSVRMGLVDNKVFASVIVSAFMHIVGILQLPNFLGSSFSPFNSLGAALLYITTLSGKSKSTTPSTSTSTASNPVVKKKRNRGRKTNANSNGAKKEL
uniref:Uncharacterized protein n=1 Tax=Attheya septentrionalis TaxID=420275 RepID=A0A7S2UB07_9STRA|mmetsp:Transcript_18043/g.32713  ORF Transcript_18043/g.32713 Transcript_18043/m.32713 type:complete len:310 (+) Transcript_18043:7-936(+)